MKAFMFVMCKLSHLTALQRDISEESKSQYIVLKYDWAIRYILLLR